jgi:glycosyltransferase involved in cell wall biosynthesis
LYSCGRLNPIKGHEYVIGAVKLLRSRGIDARLEIGGEDEQGGSGYRKHLERLIDSEGMRGHVQLLGSVSEARNYRAYQNAHVYVMGSLNEAAGAVAAMEAMALEVPVVMPGTGATPELISHEQSGLLVRPKSAEELANAIERVLDDPAFAIRLGRAGRQKVIEEYSHRRSALQISQFLIQTGLRVRSTHCAH